jgi:hypothetical protein
MRTEKSRVNSKVGWGTRVRLHIDAPLFWVESVSLKGTLLAKNLNLVNDFITSVVTSSWQTFGVLVGKSRTEALHDSLGGEILRRNQLKGTPLTRLFLLNEVVKLRIVILKGDETGEFL